MTTTIDIPALRALLEKATKGPFRAFEHSWEQMSVYAGNGDIFCGVRVHPDTDELTEDTFVAQMRNNAELAAAALNALPALLDAAKERDRLREALSNIEDMAFDGSGKGGCGFCQANWKLANVALEETSTIGDT